MTVLGDGVFKEVISYNEVIWVGPEPVGQVPLLEKEIRTPTAQGRPREDTGRRWSSAAKERGLTRNQCSPRLDLNPCSQAREETRLSC